MKFRDILIQTWFQERNNNGIRRRHPQLKPIQRTFGT
jgi:hypothetical protein